MSRLYTVIHAGTITNAGGDVDLLEATPADDKPIRLRRMVCSQISEVADAAEEGLRISVMILPATVTSGSGGSSPTPQPPDSADAAAGFTAETGNTTVATTSGTARTIEELGWNIRNTPMEIVWPDDKFCPTVRGTEVLIVRQQTTAADDYTGQFSFGVEEL